MNIIPTKKFTNFDLLIVPTFAGEEIKTLKSMAAGNIEIFNLAKTDFKNTAGNTLLFYIPNENIRRVLLVGLGERKRLNQQILRRSIQAGLIAACRLDLEAVGLKVPAIAGIENEKLIELISFSAVFGSYRFDAYKKDAGKPIENLYLLVNNLNRQALDAATVGVLIGNATNSARNLSNHPGNVATPSHLAAHAIKSAKKYGFNCRVLGPKEIHKEGLGLLEGVAQGSSEEAKFIILSYGKPSKEPIVLIGKGLTFDSGGISIKPSEKMEEMKYDMSGGATVLSIFEAASQLKLPVSLVGLIPSSENLISGAALKPGDILKSHAGKTVEIINTDAEGRLILADAISFAKKYYTPVLMVDFATLTGSVIHALGDEYAGFMSNTKQYTQPFQAAGAASGESFWPLPLVESYKEILKSGFADIKNAGDKGFAGAIAGGLFLEYFVGQTSWIHFDTAGTSWSTRSKNYAPAGSTGWGVYLTVQFLSKINKRSE